MIKRIVNRSWFFLSFLLLLLAGMAGPAAADWQEGEYRIVKAFMAHPSVTLTSLPGSRNSPSATSVFAWAMAFSAPTRTRGG